MTGMDWTLATLLPLVTLGALGAIVPIALAPRFPDTQPGLARAIALSVVLLVLSGTILFVMLYSEAGMSPGQLAQRPTDSLRHFLALGLKSALVWGPVTALTALVLAQGVERRRGERMAARDRD